MKNINLHIQKALTKSKQDKHRDNTQTRHSKNAEKQKTEKSRYEIKGMSNVERKKKKQVNWTSSK